MIVFVALGLFGLRSRMREQYYKYRLTIFRWKWMRYTVPILFAAGNALVLITAALEHRKNKIPRFWWPVAISCILAASFLYWLAIRITQTSIKWKGEKKIIGQLIGFEVLVYYQNSENLPPKMKDDIADALTAKIDGSTRRVEVKVCSFQVSFTQGRKH